MVIARGSVWWADLGDPIGSAPGFVRPVLVVSADSFNASRIATVIVVVLTSNLRLGAAPGNVTLPKGTAGLPKTSIVNVTQVATIDKSSLIELVGLVGDVLMETISQGLRLSMSL